MKASERLEAGQVVRVPPLPQPATSRPATSRPGAARSAATAPAVTAQDAAALQAAVLYRDDNVIALDKPAGLAVQGGSGQRRHLDGMLEALRFGADRKSTRLNSSH